MRGATVRAVVPLGVPHISIHAPHAGSDESVTSCAPALPLFQSTLPMQRATLSVHTLLHRATYFNPRSPCGVRPVPRHKDEDEIRFQSTLPMRGATLLCLTVVHQLVISIHAPHAGSDQYPSVPVALRYGFQSTLPMRGATSSFPADDVALSVISIHAPHAGSDSPASTDRNGRIYFNPRSPCGERHSITVIIQISFLISIHDPHTGSDRTNSVIHSPRQQSFQSTLPMRGATHL